MGKPTMFTKKQFIADVEERIKSRSEILASIAADRAILRGDSEPG